MMEQRPKVKLNINAFGKSKVEVEGVTGSACTDLTQGIETALGANKGVHRDLKSSYYEEPVKAEVHEYT